MKRSLFRKKVLLLFAVILVFYPMGAVLADSLSEAQQEKEELMNALEDAEKLIDQLKGSKEDIQSKVVELDKKLTEISTDIVNLKTELEEKNTQIEDTSKELSEAESDEKAQYESMKIRIQYMYLNSRGTYIDRIFASESFGDFLNTVQYISSITEYDRKMLVKYQETQKKVADAKLSLETDKAQLETMQAKVEEEKKAVEALIGEKETQLAGVSEDLESASDTADVYAAEIQAQNDVISQIQAAEAAKKAAKEAAKKAAAEKAAKEAEEKAAAEEAKREAEAGSTEIPSEGNAEAVPPAEEPEQEPVEEPVTTPDSYNGGAFAWPCPSSTRVTSDYGNRLSPTAGASSNHKGIDIGAEYGADIVAAADGTVIFAGYSSGSGNYVMIDHGGSLYTVYMHASSLSVSNGQQVKKGEVVAKIGSTGISTGNHLHFGVSLEGSYVSPWNYLSR